jgi:exosortase A-associated hydrolase 1
VNFEERAVSFSCHDSWLYGIITLPERPVARGVLIVVGGPQYRVGSHRQFTLLARHLAAHGMPIMRFDYRGMGDSEGDMRNFEEVNDDIREATNQFFREVPAIKDIVIWGLCDAASAALFYAYRDPRVSGLVLLNPWVRTVEGEAKAYLKHYYLSRLANRELWQKMLRGRFDYARAARSAWNMAKKALPGKAPMPSPTGDAEQSLPDRMSDAFGSFKGKVLLIISGKDLTAQEFLDLIKGSRKWQKLTNSPRVQRRDLPDANHTFSQRDWRDQVSSWTTEWTRSW